MRRLSAIFLTLALLVLGSGLLERLHDAQHQFEDAQEISAAQREHRPFSPEHHDETNCAVHAQLHLPLLPLEYAPLFICVALLVVRSAFIPQYLDSQTTPLRIDCRGPPALA